MFTQLSFVPIALLITLTLSSTSLWAQPHVENFHQTQSSESKKIAFVAGRMSHGYGAHEHYAGCSLLARHLEMAIPGTECVVFKHSWPEKPEALDEFDCVVMYADGGGGHPVIPHLDQVERLAARGIGIVCIHYAVEVSKGDVGDRFLKLLGGYFETHWSVNPHWVAKFESFPDHPISRGVKPFAIQDEWYFHMRFQSEMADVTPILSAVAPAETMSRADGPHSGNPHVRIAVEKGLPQHVAWATERADGGRSFGFTGGHDHWNWGHDEFRKVVLNAIVWCAKGDVPANGVTISSVGLDELKQNQDFPPPDDYDFERAKQRLKTAGE